MLEVTADIASSAAVAWGLLTDTRGRVQTTVGLWVPFEITNWEEGAGWAWRVAGIPATGHRVTPVSATCCRVAFLVPRWAPLYVPVCRIALKKLAALARSQPNATGPTLAR